MSKPTRGLGRGLAGLIQDNSTITNKPEEVINTGNVANVDINLIEPNPTQPRNDFDEEKLQELSASIKTLGIIQPITLRKTGDKYQIISGERRYRASKMAGLDKIPSYITDVDDSTMLQMALVENIQREDLNAIEVALAYEHLLENSNTTQEKLAGRIGKSRADIANYLRLLRLPALVQMSLQKKEIGMGHARALLAIESPSMQIKIFKEILKNGYSVRNVEDLVKRIKNGESIDNSTKKTSQKSPTSAEFDLLKKRLSQFFDTQVQINCSNGKGKISIPFANEEELERIMNLFDKMKESK